MKTNLIEDYISTVPQESQEKLKELHMVIREVLPDAEEMISYGVPTYKRNGRSVVYIAGFKKHISLYPILESIDASIKEVAKYKAGKGTMHFPLDEPLPLPLIRTVVKVLLAENEARTKKK